jgi:hypothetical protein
MQREFSKGENYPFGCNGYVTAMAAGQSQRFYSDVGIFSWYFSQLASSGPSFPGRSEPNRAKPRELGASFPALHQAQIKIPGVGQTMLPRAARLLAQTGYFYSAWFSLGNGSSPKTR